MKTPVISPFRSTFCVAMLGVLLAPNASAQRGSAGGAIGGLVVGVQGGVYSQQQRPTGTLTGFILDDRGLPAIRVMVQALSESTAPDGTRRTNTFGSRPTDADGRFRIDNLPPGQYLVAAAPMPMGRPTADSTALGITYYPGVVRQQEAQSVTVSDGGEQAVIIQLQRVQTFHIRGTVSSSTGRSPVGLSVFAIEGDVVQIPALARLSGLL